jgi:hypothetical protein
MDCCVPPLGVQDAGGLEDATQVLLLPLHARGDTASIILDGGNQVRRLCRQALPELERGVAVQTEQQALPH